MQKVTIRSAIVCHDGLLFISACHHVPLAARPPATCALGESQSDMLAGELERVHAVEVSRGKLLVAAVVLSLPEACRSPDLAGAQGASRQAFSIRWPSRQAPLAGVSSLPGKLLLPGPWLAFPASSSCRGLGWPSRQAPLAGALSPWLEYFVLEWLQRNHGGPWRSPGKPCRGALQLPVHKFGILGYPYSSTPTVNEKRVTCMKNYEWWLCHKYNVNYVIMHSNMTIMKRVIITEQWKIAWQYISEWLWKCHNR